jgi:hypothetical protein
MYGSGALVPAVTGLIFVVWLVYLFIVMDSPGDGEKEVFAHLTALLVLAAFTTLSRIGGRGVGLVLGKDNRISTSKLQAMLWTYAIAGAMASTIAANWVGDSAGFDALFEGEFDIGPYLVLLGGPFAAAVGARALIGMRIGKGDSIKPPGSPSASQALTNDRGDADLIDSQYLLFNLIALMYFVGAFVTDPSEGLPEIPTVLYALTGASALGYVSSKAIPSGRPEIASISPSVGTTRTQLTVYGSGLLFPRNPTSSRVPRKIEEFHRVEVQIGGRRAPIVDGSLSSTEAGGDRLRVTVPDDLQPGQAYDVIAMNFRGTETNAAEFRTKPAKPRRRIGIGRNRAVDEG